MPDAENPTTCPHCGAVLSRVELPDAAGFDEPSHLVCFNDECSYYVRGWTWMLEQFGVHSSYRYRVSPGSGRASPIAVWSPTALRSHIIADRDAGDTPLRSAQ